ncbi:phosphatidic acid phosphatase type 2/haloperoxidase [Morchella snyderi]|nr:phosphatidic acid phosphatase type 2/haloperoxidase [Morchella snyderi]
MGLFSRNTEAAAPAGNSTSSKHHHRRSSASHGHPEKHRQVFGRHMNERPTIGEWLRTIWLDIITMACLGAVGLGVYMAPPAPSRSFPVYFQDGEIVYPQFAYPLRKNIIPIWLAAFLAFFVPLVFFTLFQIRVRSFWDFNAAVVGLLYSLINAAVFQVFLKWLIGGLRPHFLAVCKPNLPDVGMNTGSGLRQIMYDRSICTGDEKEINDSLESFPSGHSTAAFAGFIFLYLYFNAKMKVFSNYHGAMWKQTLLYAPVLGAVLIAGSLTIDEYHHYYDVIAGAIIGTMFALSSFRMVYASVWDFRFNHIPLPRGSGTLGFSYTDSDEMRSFHDAMATRKAGWGTLGGGLTGAPFDATSAAVDMGDLVGGSGRGARMSGRRRDDDVV